MAEPLNDREGVVRALQGKRTFAEDHPINGRSPIAAPPDQEGREEALGGPRVYLVRHGATKLNNTTDTSQDRIRGWTDVPLTDEGRAEAKKAASALEGKGVGYIATSDLSRARETADIIGKKLGLKAVPMMGLRPWNLGEFSGKSTKEVLPQLADYVQKRPAAAVPGGESFDDFKERAFQGIADALKGAAGRPLAIVTHHRLERLMEAWRAAGQPASHAIDIATFLEKGDPPGGVEELHLDTAALKGGGGPDNPADGGGAVPPKPSMIPATPPPSDAPARPE
jgi:alpha-ribazole phosphatase